MNRVQLSLYLLLLMALYIPGPLVAEEGLVAHWRLATDGEDSSGNGHPAVNHGARFDGTGSALFDGIDAWLEVEARGDLQLGRSDFSVAAWIYTEKDLDDVLGDVVSWYDPATANGFTLGLMNYAGVTSAQSNWRNVFFGIDAGQLAPAWIDRGRPGNNHHVKSLVVFDGDLYASTWEPDAGDAGHVYRYAGDTRWIDCGAPSPANSLTGLAVYQGRLYAGSELYSGSGSSLPPSPPANHGGHDYPDEGRGRCTN